jgi:hypothetical protein
MHLFGSVLLKHGKIPRASFRLAAANTTISPADATDIVPRTASTTRIAMPAAREWQKSLMVTFPSLLGQFVREE